MKNVKIAILGVTGHIAKGLIINFLRNGGTRLFLFARTPKKIIRFLKNNNLRSNCYIGSLKQFNKGEYDVIINCVGLGTPLKLAALNNTIFGLTEKFDDLVLWYLKLHPKTVYINFSSGAVYTVTPDALKVEHFYGVAKLYQEARHRALCNLNIVDIRIFSYFSRFIDPESGYFLTDLIKSIRERRVFVTDSHDFTRDFLSSDDLFSLVHLVIKARPFNDVVEAYSSKTVTKFALLNYFSKKHSLKYVIKQKINVNCPTGRKNRYYSRSKKAHSLLGYKPKFSSLQTVMKEAGYLLDEQTV